MVAMRTPEARSSSSVSLSFDKDMKLAFSIAVVLLATTSVYSWMHPFPDYKKQFETSDLVAVVRVRNNVDTGSTKQLERNSKIWFREVETEMEVLSVLKGAATNTIRCRLYRFPTKLERVGDLGERDAEIQYAMATPWESGLFIPKVKHEYLVYLKHSGTDYYIPAGGIQTAAYSILRLKVSFVTDPDREVEQAGRDEPPPRPSDQHD